MSAKVGGRGRKAVSSRKSKAKTVKAKPSGIIIVDASLADSPEAKAALAKQERRGYTIAIVNGICTADAPVNYEVPLLFLAPYASWWADKFWGMLDAKVKGREKEASK